MKDTLELWKDFVNGKYDIYLSQITIDEIGKCTEPRRNLLFDFLSDIEYTKLEINAEIVELVQKIIDMGILKPKSFDDCQHIVNIKTIRGIRAITNLEGYKGIEIINPSVLLESEG